MDLTIVTCNYNTPDLIVNLIKSIAVTCEEAPKFLVMETGNKPSTKRIDGVKYFFLENTIHGEAVNKAFELVNTRYVLLVDSDVIFLKDFKPAFESFKEKGFTLMGKVVGNVGEKSLYERVEPWYCFIDLDKLKEHNIKFFDAERTKKSKEEGIKIYDIGSTMFEDVTNADLFVGNVNLEEKYFRHYGGMSWRAQKYNPSVGDTDIDFGGTHPHKVLWDIAQEVQKRYLRDTYPLNGMNIGMRSPFASLMMQDLSSNDKWDMMSEFYFKYLSNKSKDILIPKKIHQIWLGGMVPDEVLELGVKIKSLHPDWEYKLWTDEDVENYPLINQELFDSTYNNGAKSDILRCEILYNEGGVYLDTDFEMIKPFDEILGGLEFFGGVGRVENPEIHNSIFGCTPKHHILYVIVHNFGNEAILDKVVEAYPHSDKTETFTITGSYYLSYIVFDYMNSFPDAKIVIFPTEYFYPFPADFRFNVWVKGRKEMRETIHSFNTIYTTAIHLWENSWQEQRKLFVCEQ